MDASTHFISAFKIIIKLTEPYEYLMKATLFDHSIYKNMENPFFSGFRLPCLDLYHNHGALPPDPIYQITVVKKMYQELREEEYLADAIKLAWHNGRNVGVNITLKSNGLRVNVSHTHHNAVLCLLFIACMFNDINMISYIISLDNFPINNAKNNLRCSILQYVIIDRDKSTEEKTKIIEILLKHPRINVNKRMTSKYFNGTPLALAKRKPEIFKLLIEHPSIDINKSCIMDCRNRIKETILYEAVSNQDIQRVNTLLNYTIDVNKGTDEGFANKSPLYCAISRNNIEIVKVLLSHKDIDVNNGRGGITPLLHAINLSRFDIAKLLLSMPDIKIFSSIETEEIIGYNYIEDYGNKYWDSEEGDDPCKAWPIVYGKHKNGISSKINIFDLLTYENRTKSTILSEYLSEIECEIERGESEQRRIERNEDLAPAMIVELRERWHREKDEKIQSCVRRADEEYKKYIHDREALLKLITDRFGIKNSRDHLSIRVEHLEPIDSREIHILAMREAQQRLIQTQEVEIPEVPEVPISNRSKNKKFITECREEKSVTATKYNINYIGRFRTTPLIESIKAGNLRVTSILLSTPKIKMNLKDIDGRTALDYLIALDNDGYRNSHYTLDDLNNKNYIVHGPLKYLPILLKSATIDEIQNAYSTSSVERTKKLIHDILRKRVSRTIIEIDLFSNLPQLPCDVYKYIITRMLVPETKWWPAFSRHRESKMAIQIKDEVHDKLPCWGMREMLEKFVHDKTILEKYDKPLVIEVEEEVEEEVEAPPPPPRPVRLVRRV